MVNFMTLAGWAPVRAYLRLRARVLGRQLRELGWWRLVLIGFMTLALVGTALGQAARHPRGQWAVPVVVLSLVWSGHRRRSDLAFLRAAGPGFRWGLAAEYALLALPAVLVLAVFGDVGAALATLVLPPLAALAGPAREWQPRRWRPRSLFRSETFEWVSGMRSVVGGPLWLALLAGALWQHRTPLGAGLALAGWLLVVSSFYGTPEPATMLLVAARSPGAFLRRRLLLALGYLALTGAPFAWLLATSGAGPGAAAGAALLLSLITSLLILIKYAFYPNSFLIRFSQSIVVAFVLSQPGNPVYPPLLAALLGGVIWQSRRRLGQFRYD